MVQLGATDPRETLTHAPFSSPVLDIDDYVDLRAPRSRPVPTFDREPSASGYAGYTPSPDRAPSTSGTSTTSGSHTYYDSTPGSAMPFAFAGASSGAGGLAALEAFFGQRFAPRQQASALACLRFGAEAARRRTLATRGDR